MKTLSFRQQAFIFTGTKTNFNVQTRSLCVTHFPSAMNAGDSFLDSPSMLILEIASYRTNGIFIIVKIVTNSFLDLNDCDNVYIKVLSKLKWKIPN